MKTQLYIGELAWNVTESDLEQLVAPHAQVLETRIVTDRDSGRSRGFAFMTVEAENVRELIKTLDGQELSGRALSVTKADDRPGRDRGRSGGPRRRSRH